MFGFGRCATEFPSELRRATDAETKTVKTIPSLREKSLRSAEKARRRPKVFPKCENRATTAALHKISQRELLVYK